LAGKEILTYDDLLQIVELIKSAEAFSEFHLKVGDIELDLRKANAASPVAPDATAPVAHVNSAATPAASAPVAAAPQIVVAGAAAKARPPVDIPAGSVAIRSPMVGTFYRAPEPGAPPFVAVGQNVTPETTVCIIEVMKLMNSIPAGTRGTVTHVLVDDAEPVDSGQVLIIIDPKA
jgi:acetyl-CoA carboxylase biotin carboxyl carrier protein